MVYTRKQKQAVAAASNPLSDAGFLKQVFKYLPGNHLFLAAVCREWQAVYAGMTEQQLCRLSMHFYTQPVTCNNLSTLYSAAVASPSTARLAVSCGLTMSNNIQLQWSSGLHADIATLTVLQDLGMAFSDYVVNAIALSGRLHILQHFLTELQCPVPSSISHYAARSGSISMLNWLRAESLCAFKENTCAGAADGGQLAVVKYLRSIGCKWEERFIPCRAARCGSIEMVEWLRQQQGIEFGVLALSWAAGAGHIAMCKHLRSAGCE
jgi:hypothetical protein